MIRVLIAEDSAILRDTLVAVLDLEEDLAVVAAVATGPEIVPAASSGRRTLPSSTSIYRARMD